MNNWYFQIQEKFFLCWDFFILSGTFWIFFGMTLHEKFEIALDIVHTLLSNHISVPTTLNNIGLTQPSFQKQVLYLIYLILICVVGHVLKKKLFVRWQIYSWQIHTCYKSPRNVSEISVGDNRTEWTVHKWKMKMCVASVHVNCSCTSPHSNLISTYRGNNWHHFGGLNKRCCFMCTIY